MRSVWRTRKLGQVAAEAAPGAKSTAASAAAATASNAVDLIDFPVRFIVRETYGVPKTSTMRRWGCSNPPGASTATPGCWPRSAAHASGRSATTSSSTASRPPAVGPSDLAARQLVELRGDRSRPARRARPHRAPGLAAALRAPGPRPRQGRRRDDVHRPGRLLELGARGRRPPAIRLLGEVGEAIEPPIARPASGEVVKRLGDGLMAAFWDAAERGRGCLRGRASASREIEVDGYRPRLRTGIHLGRPRRIGATTSASTSTSPPGSPTPPSRARSSSPTTRSRTSSPARSGPRSAASRRRARRVSSAPTRSSRPLGLLLLAGPDPERPLGGLGVGAEDVQSSDLEGVLAGLQLLVGLARLAADELRLLPLLLGALLRPRFLLLRASRSWHWYPVTAPGAVKAKLRGLLLLAAELQPCDRGALRLTEGRGHRLVGVEAGVTGAGPRAASPGEAGELAGTRRLGPQAPSPGPGRTAASRPAEQRISEPPTAPVPAPAKAIESVCDGPMIA